MSVVSETQKRKKYSKRKKANLRKYTKIRDVEEYIEDVSRQQKTGGIVADKTDAELFTIETCGAETGSEHNRTSKLSSRRIWKPLKCEKNLVNDSKVKPVVSKTSKSWKSKAIAKTKLLAKKRCSGVKKQYDPIDDISTKLQQSQQCCDLWSKADGNDNGLDDDYYNQATGRKRVKRPRSMGVHQKASLLPAVEVAHPGASYNPSFTDHQDLLYKAVNVEAEKLKKIESLHQTFSLPSMSHKEREATWHEEMTKGLFDAESSSDEGIGSDSEGVQVKAPVLADRRKTLKTRRKEEERKAEESKRIATKKDSVQLNEVYRLKSIVKELQLKEASTEAKKKTKQVKRDNARFQAKRLGKLEYVDADIDLKLSEELSGSLRTLKPEGNIIRERLKSLQKRNKIETRQMVMPYRRYKLKEKEKWSCK